MRRALSKKGRSQQGWRGSTAERPGDGRIAKSGSFSPTPVRKGPRLYEWAWLQLPDETEAASERARWVLIRRSLSDRSERAYYRVCGPATTTLAEVVRVTGSRWKIEEGYEQAKGEVGLDQFEVRSWRAWYRYMTLALLAYAALVVMRAQARAQEKKMEASASG